MNKVMCIVLRQSGWAKLSEVTSFRSETFRPPPQKKKKKQQQQTLKHENEQCMLWRCQSLCLEPCQIHFESVRIIDRMIQTPLN